MHHLYKVILTSALLIASFFPTTLFAATAKKIAHAKKHAQPIITVERRPGTDDLPVASDTLTSLLIRDETTASNLVDVGSTEVWPLASLTKLMTAMVFLDHNPGWNKRMKLTAADEVGGARLRVKAGTPLTTKEAITVGLMASANNTINALARSTGLTRERFVAAMNAKAKKLGMLHTTFVEPTGIDPANVSTAQDAAILIRAAEQKKIIQKILQTKKYSWYNRAAGTYHPIKNSNKLLDVAPFTVLGGKTGLLDESGGNLVMRVTDGKHPLTIVVFGAKALSDTFGIAQQVALWAWGAHEWVIKKG